MTGFNMCIYRDCRIQDQHRKTNCIFFLLAMNNQKWNKNDIYKSIKNMTFTWINLTIYV